MLQQIGLNKMLYCKRVCYDANLILVGEFQSVDA